MKTFGYGLLLGLIVGMTVMIFASGFDGQAIQKSKSVVRDLASATVMDHSDVVTHRREGFKRLETVASLLSLPEDSLRSEALHVLCGRSDFAQLLIIAEDANRISNSYLRLQFLRTVFRRLADVDPAAALELARAERFFQSRTPYATVLQTWARNDLMGAVLAVSRIDDNTKSMSAQMLYSAIGGAYTPEAEFVEQELQIAPFESNRSRFVRELFAVSPDAALDHIMSLESESHRSQQIKLIANIFSFDDFLRAESFGARIPDSTLRREYLAVVYSRLGQEQPLVAAQKQFSLRDSEQLSKTEKRAFELIVREDMNAAIALFADPANADIQKQTGAMIAKAYGKVDPSQALQWAIETDESVRPGIVGDVLRSAAEQDPTFALQQVIRLDDSDGYKPLSLELFTSVASKMPRVAANEIQSIADPGFRNLVSSRVARSWIQSDAFAALDWVLNTTEQVQQTVFLQRGLIGDVELHEAQTIVASIPKEFRGIWLGEVVGRLIQEKNADEAVRFIDQFAGEEDHAQQVAMVVSRIARSDSDLALQYLGTVSAGNNRDAVLSSIIDSRSGQNPQNALDLLSMIDDQDLRQHSAARVATSWLRSEPAAARRWIDSMPAGSERDNILMNAVVDGRLGTQIRAELTQQISDVNKRDQAMLVQAIGSSQNNPAEIAELLERIEMPEIFRQQLKSEIIRGSLRSQ